VKHERATEEIKETAALYALGSLTQREARSFESHIKAEGCSVCAAEFRKFERAVSGIGFGVDEAPAPVYIRDLLAARIEREPRATAPILEANPAVEEKTMHDLLRPSSVAPRILSQPGSDGPSMLPWVLVIALAVIGLAIGYSWKSARDLNGQLEAKVSATQSDIEDLQKRLNDTREHSGALQNILSTLAKPGTRIARLVIQSASPASSATAIWDTERGNCLVLGKLQPAPEGKIYQLWFFTPASKVSAGPLKIGSNGFVTISTPRDAANAVAVVITLEPDNGSQIPTSPYYAVGRID
jgi:anti-sigma-K factor RskA